MSKKNKIEQINEMFDTLTKLGSTSAKLYQKLAELEINHQEYTKEYYDLWFLIPEIIKLEEKEWKKFKLNDQFVTMHTDSIARKYNLVGEDVLFALSISDEDTNIRRMISHFSSEALRRNEIISIESLDPEDYEEYARQEGCTVINPADYGLTPEDVQEIGNQLQQKLEQDNLIYNEIEMRRNDILGHTFLQYLQDAIDQEQNEQIRAELIKAKYRTICINQNLENDFLDKGPRMAMPKLMQKLVQRKIIGNEKAFSEVYTDVIKEEIEKTISELNTIDFDEITVDEGSVYLMLEVLYTKALNSINVSYKLDGILQVLKQNALKKSQTDFAKKDINDCFTLKKDLRIAKNVDL